MPRVIIHGPRHSWGHVDKGALVKHFGCERLIDNWMPPHSAIVDGGLHCTHVRIGGDVVRVIMGKDLIVMSLQDALQSIETEKQKA